MATKLKKILLSAILGLTGVFGALVCKSIEVQAKGPDRAALIEELKRSGAEIEFSDAEDLKTIRIRSTDFQAWEKINALPEVQRLDLAGSSIGDDAVGHLLKLKNLRELYLDATEITGISLAEIGRIATLDTLGVANLKIVDEDLQGLRNLKGLSRLNLGGTLVTDASINQTRVHRICRRPITQRSSMVSLSFSKLSVRGPSLLFARMIREGLSEKLSTLGERSWARISSHCPNWSRSMS